MSESRVSRGSGRRRPRSRVLAVVLSGLFPGLGQLYNGDAWRALAFVVAAVVTGFGPWNPLTADLDVDDPAQGLRTLLLASLPFLVVALWSAVDAWRRAGRRDPEPDSRR